MTAGEQGVRNCLKNPGHEQFYNLVDLNTDILPDGCKTEVWVDFIRKCSKRVVKLMVKKSDGSELYGSGYVVKNSYSGDLYIRTQNFIVGSHEDVKNCSIDFFYDTADRTGVETSNGLTELNQCDWKWDEERDIVYFRFHPVPQTITQLMSESVVGPPPTDLDEPNIIAISHPHGGPKKITTGKWLGRDDVEANSHIHTARTCPGSAGCLVIDTSNVYSLFGWPYNIQLTHFGGKKSSKYKGKTSDTFNINFAKELDVGNKARRAPIKWQKGPLLGFGAFGKVHKCHDENTGEVFAVKMVPLGNLNAKITEAVLHLENELLLLRDLQHERVVQYFGFENDGEVISIFIEYMPRGSVKKIIDEQGKLQESVVKKYSRQILLGLEYLHTNRIVHRDIKAANVLIDNDDNIKLADLGLSKRLLTMCSATKSFVGSPYWMAPEVIKTEDYGRKADIWSFGCTVVEMLSSNPPFHKYEPWAAIFQIATCEQPKYELPDIISSLAEEFLTHTFQRTPADRWSAENLLQHEFVKDET